MADFFCGEKRQEDVLDLQPYYQQGDWLVVVNSLGGLKGVHFTNLGIYVRKNKKKSENFCCLFLILHRGSQPLGMDQVKK